MLRPYVPAAGLWPDAAGSSVGSATPFAGAGAGGGGGGAAAVTAIVAVSALVSLVATTPVAPAVLPVTRPEDDTVATAGFRLVHTIVRPVSALPFKSRVLAASCVVAPMFTVSAEGVTMTEATGCGDGGSDGVPNVAVNVA